MSLLYSLTPSKLMLSESSIVHPSQLKLKLLTIPSRNRNKNQNGARRNLSLKLCYFDSTTSISSSSKNSTAVIQTTSSSAPPVMRKRRRYRKLYPGESEGITEEMRFVAMRLRNLNGKKHPSSSDSSNSDSENSQDLSNDEIRIEEEKAKQDSDGQTWKPSMEGFVKYLVDSQLVFNTVERIVDVSNDVACKFLSYLHLFVCLLYLFIILPS